MTLEEEVVALGAALAEAQALIARQQATIAQLEARIAALEQTKTSPPSWTKANRPVRDPQERARRAPEHNHGRRRSVPTRVEEHAYAHCPDCGYALAGHTLKRRREVIEVPLGPVEITEHRLLTRYCPACAAWKTPHLDLGGQVLGQGRIGTRLASLIATLRAHLRLPLAQVQQVLATLWHLHLSEGALAEVLRRVAIATAGERAALEAAIRASPAVHADETGWRENGRNGYIWVRATPHGERLFTYDHSRAGTVAQALLDDCVGVRCTDFYAAYNGVSGRKQRCWAHLLRDLHALKEAHPDAADVQAWAGALRALYDRGQVCSTQDLTTAQRERAYRQLEDRSRRLGQCYARAAGHPCQTLAQRLLRHRGEFFEFVRVPALGATNNEAERALRPLVIARKISGGSRSPQGTCTRLALASLFQTWHAQGRNPFQTCLAALQPLPPQL